MPPVLGQALAQTWPPFALIAGLLLVGVVAASDGLFESAGAGLARLPGGGRVLFASLMALVVAVTVVLNLDTSVVFLTPVLLHAARRRGLGETAFLYGAVFMSNSASLLLPGSNLTNLLVLDGHGVTGGSFAAGMAPAWIVAVLVTGAVLAVWRRHDLAADGGPATGERPPWHAGVGAVAVVVVTALVLVVPDPALPVLVTGVAAAGVQVQLGRLRAGGAVRALGAVTLGSLFLVAVALGALARTWGAPGRLLASAGATATAWIATAAACLVNNLPAAVLLSSKLPAHPRALLVGLDLGPNLAVTGSLSAVLWLRAGRAEGGRPSVRTYSAVGLVLVPLTVTAALAALALVPPFGR